MTLTAWLFPAQIFTPQVLAVLAWVAFGKILLGIGWEALTSVPGLRAHRVFRVPVPAGQRWREIKSSWHVFSDVVVLYVLLRANLLQLAPNTLGGTLATFGVFYVWVEVFYYFTHRWMHEYDFLYPLHRSHHLTQIVTPLSSISMSWVEKWIFYTGPWLSFMAAMSWVMPVTLYGIAAYYTFHFIISLHGHSNTETSRIGCFLSSALSFGSAASHAVHHARFRANYGFSCMLLDKLLGTYADDTEQLQSLAVQRNGVTSLKRMPPGRVQTADGASLQSQSALH